MGAFAGVYRATYKDKKTGKPKKAATWIATYWDAIRRRTVKEYGFTSAAAASKRRAEVMLKGRAATGATLTLRQVSQFVVDDYVSKGRKPGNVLKQVQVGKRVAKYLGGETLARYVDEPRIQGMIAAMRADGYSSSTINHSLRHIRRGYRLAARRFPGLAVPHVPMQDERPDIRQGFIEPDQLAALLAAMPESAAKIVRVLHLTGWRVSEVISRRWSDLEDGMLHLRPGETKNGNGRTFPLEPDLRRIIGKQPKGAVYIFGESIPAITHTLRHAWDAARARTGLRHLILHDLRRTAARDLVRAGVDRDTAKRLLGHETDSIFSRYRIIRGDDLRLAAKALSTYRLGTNSQ